MPEPSEESSGQRGRDVVAKLPRNVAVGIVVMFVLTVLIALPAGAGLQVAVGIALVPAVFAGPFVGGLITVALYETSEEHPEP
ncbi:hypothetical protein [Aquihabitans sp. McL0605]|uniref:hypothetical protein n=1 Tax=Aquihabitans sp. McL0605 TaxID=3415671 RepID=UPI003CF65D3A